MAKRRLIGPAVWLALFLVMHAGAAAAEPSSPNTGRSFLPLVAVGPEASCPSVPGAGYGALTVLPPPTDRPAEEHADLNLALRSYSPTSGYLGLVDYGGPADPSAPQLAGLFGDNRSGVFVRLHRVYDWNWTCNCRGQPLASPPVTLAELATTPGEAMHVPDSGYSIGSGYEVLVLYAAPNRITLTYTRNDNVVHGYTLHLENLCVDRPLLNLYQSLNAADRTQLPALLPGQAFGRATGATVGVAIRDNGVFLDPRSRKDWWQGR